MNGSAQAATPLARPAAGQPAQAPEATLWQRWVHHPDTLWLRKCAFYAHLWVSIAAGIYIAVISLSGAALVFRNEIEARLHADARPDSFGVHALLWLVRLHENLLLGEAGRRLNGLGALLLTLIALTGAFLWWPGISRWRQSLSLHRKSGFGRLNWELHNVLGFSCGVFLLLWGISGFYFAWPEAFDPFARAFDSLGSFHNMQLGDLILTWVSNLHFGRFSLATKILWTVLGLVPAVLLFTGAFMCCRRWIYGLHPPHDRH